MSQLKEEQISEHRDVFSLFDKRGDSKIDSAQIGDVLRALGQNPTEDNINKIVNEMDPTGDRRISFEEFLPRFQDFTKRSPPGSMDDFVDGLRVFDKDGNGTINSAELRHVLGSLGDKLTEKEIDDLLAGLVNQQGDVNYEEFVKIVMSG